MKALNYGHYSYVPSEYLTDEEAKKSLLPWESLVNEDDDREVVGTGWYEEVEQWGGEFDCVIMVYGGSRGEIIQFVDLPTPNRED